MGKMNGNINFACDTHDGHVPSTMLSLDEVSNGIPRTDGLAHEQRRSNNKARQRPKVPSTTRIHRSPLLFLRHQ